MNANIMIFNTLDQLTFTKLSSKLKINYWRLYKTSTDINRQFVVLSVHVLNAFNAHMSEADIKELFNVNWMLMRLKEEIKLVFMIIQMFIWIIKNQSVKD